MLNALIIGSVISFYLGGFLKGYDEAKNEYYFNGMLGAIIFTIARIIISFIFGALYIGIKKVLGF